ncbi:lantibiotic dehydratase [Streptomyces tsukubensis]|uniref:Lantibiotic dehydratase N-terminal domain-containing protein n=1 Tax=Streptomyces tsukubensis TaxID=83656 RepID=A0A1V4AA84_9ACTN|nr:lantibiotic dehydratase [Streptomyces tsukubensis]OON79712.1 hypothetical protein B1H18_14220 [Streptomyces tsukubensis]QFR95901.1 hypothetical protein GBW32_26250 [Streptomyces tsukubensis]
MTTSVPALTNGAVPDRVPGDGWNTLSPFVLRMSGFPFELLADLASKTATSAARHLVTTRGRLDQAVADSHSEGVLAAARTRADGAALRAVRKRRLPPPHILSAIESAEVEAVVQRFATLLHDEARAEEEFLRVFPQEELQASDQVVRLFQQHEDLRDALLVSNESSEPVLSRWIAGTRRPDRRWHKDDQPRVDTLVRHLQRACAKNDTTGHLGPFTLGSFAPGIPGVDARQTPLSRHPLLSRWAGEAIATAMRDDPEVLRQCRPRRAPGASVSGRTLRVLSFDYSSKVSDVGSATREHPPTELDEFAHALFVLCDGERTTAHLAHQVDPTYQDGGLLPQALLDALHSLEELGAIIVGPEIPYGTPDPIPELALHTGDPGGVAWRGLLQEARCHLADFGAPGSTTVQRRATLDSLKAGFEAYTGVSAERGRGTFYGDRSVLHEDCSGRYADLSIGKPLTDLLADGLPLAYDLVMAGPRRRFATESRLLGEWYAKHFPGRSEVGLHEFTTGFIEDSAQLESRYAEMDAAETAFLDRVEDTLLSGGTYDDPRIQVDTATVRELVSSAGELLPALCNPDLMIGARSPEDLAAGDFHLVLSELHSNEESLSHGLFGPMLSERFPAFPTHVLDGYRGLMAADEDLACVTLAHRNKSYIRVPLETFEIEASGRSPLPRDRVAALADLRVVWSGGALRLRHPESGRFLRMAALPYAWLGVRRNPFVPFGFPRHQGGRLLPGRRHPHLPRVTMGPVVLQRESWRVPAADLSARHRRDAFLKVQQVREDRGLCRHLYAKVAGETKPVYCDLDSPLLVRQLTRLAGRSAEPVELSEMLPAPEHLWVSDQRGHYSSELRYAAFSAPTR